MIAPAAKRKKVSVRGARRRLEVRAELFARQELDRILGEWQHINTEFATMLDGALRAAFLSGGLAVLDEVKGL